MRLYKLGKLNSVRLIVFLLTRVYICVVNRMLCVIVPCNMRASAL